MRFIYTLLTILSTFYVCITLNSAFITKHGCIYKKTKDLEIVEAVTCINLNEDKTIENRILYYSINKNNASLYLVFYEYYEKFFYKKEISKKEKEELFRLIREFFMTSMSSDRIKNYKIIKILETYFNAEDKIKLESIIQEINNENTNQYKGYKI